MAEAGYSKYLKCEFESHHSYHLVHTMCDQTTIRKQKFLQASFENRRTTFEELTKAKESISSELKRYPMHVTYPWCSWFLEEPKDLDDLLAWIECTLQEPIQKTCSPYR